MKKILLPLLGFVALATVSAYPEMMKIYLKDGSVVQYNTENIDSVKFEEQRPAAVITVSDVTLSSANFVIEPDAAVGTYNFGVVEKTTYDGYASVEALNAAELERLQAEADEWWMTLPEYLEFALYNSSEGTKEFTRDNLNAGTEYVAFVYGLSTDGKVTTPIVTEEFQTGALQAVEFNLSVSSLAAKTGIVEANPESDLYYYLGYTSAEAYEESFHGSDAELLDNALAQVVNNMIMGGTFESLARKGATQLQMSGLVPGTDYYAIAFGMEKQGENSAYATTTLAKYAFSTPGFTVTDDCTFDVSVDNVSAMLMDLTVTPSNASTRYYVTIKADSETAGKTPEQVADEQIVFEDGFQINWATSPQIFTGTQTLNSRTDLGVTNIKPETDYTIYVFGVNTDGYRTTAVSTKKARTVAAEPSEMTITFEGVTVGEETDSQDWFKTNYYVSFTPVPSVDDEYYYVGLVSVDDYEWATVFGGSDEDFMNQVITAAGEYITMNCFIGRPDQPLKATVDYAGQDLKPGTDYYLIAFGYEGTATTPLFKQQVRTSGESDSGWPGDDGGWADFGE